MASLTVFDLEKKKVGSADLDDKIFAAEIRPHLLNMAVRAQIAWKYEYKTANSKTRTEVNGTGKKMYKQKGTGQARHGDAKAPIFVGGGKAFGPRNRRVRHKINKKVMRGALITALSANHKEDRLFVVDRMELEKINTKSVSQMCKAFAFEKALIINCAEGEKEKRFNQSVKNVKGLKILRPEGINVFDILKYRNLVLSKKALEILSKRLSHV